MQAIRTQLSRISRKAWQAGILVATTVLLVGFSNQPKSSFQTKQASERSRQEIILPDNVHDLGYGIYRIDVRNINDFQKTIVDFVSRNPNLRITAITPTKFQGQKIGLVYTEATSYIVVTEKP